MAGGQVVGQDAWQIAVGSTKMHHPGIGHPFGPGPPPHSISLGAHITGQVTGQVSVDEAMGIQVSGIGQPIPSTPPGQGIESGGQVVGQVVWHFA